MSLAVDEMVCSPSEAGRMLGLSSGRIRQMIDEGKLPARKTSLGRLIPVEAVKTLAKERSRQQKESRRNLVRLGATS